MTLCWQTTAWAVLNMVVVSTVITVASPICAPLRPDERCDRSLDASQSTENLQDVVYEVTLTVNSRPPFDARPR